MTIRDDDEADLRRAIFEAVMLEDHGFWGRKVDADDLPLGELARAVDPRDLVVAQPDVKSYVPVLGDVGRMLLERLDAAPDAKSERVRNAIAELISRHGGDSR